MANELPYLPLYTSDFLIAVQTWGAERAGAYCLALFHQWEHGYVPTCEPAELGRVLHETPAKARRLWSEIASKFTIDDNGHARNERLEAVRADVRDRVAAASEKGRKGADARWGNSPGNARGQRKHMPEQGLGNSNQIQNQLSTPPQPPASRVALSIKPPTRKEREWAEGKLLEYETATQQPCPHEPDCKGQRDKCVGLLVQTKRQSEARGQRAAITGGVGYKKAVPA